MGSKKVPYSTCDYPGCCEEWPKEVENGNLDVIWGIHPEIVKCRQEPVILQKKTDNFCPRHAEIIKRVLVAVANFFGGVVGPDLDFQKGCWLTVWHNHGGLVQQELNHQFSYANFELIYRYYRSNFLGFTIPDN